MYHDELVGTVELIIIAIPHDGPENGICNKHYGSQLILVWVADSFPCITVILRTFFSKYQIVH